MSKIKAFFKKIVEKVYERIDRELVAAAADFLGARGKTLGNQVTFSVLNPFKVVVFSAGLVVGQKSLKSKLFGQRVFWFGDLNLTDEMDNLVGLSRLAGDTIYVLDATKSVVCSVRSVGNENEIKIEQAGIEEDHDGRYVVDKAFAKDRGQAAAQFILENRGWLPENLIEFYGLKKPSQAKVRRAKKAAAKGKKRAKKRA